MGHITDYLTDIAERGSSLSEHQLCTSFTEHILRNLFGYEAGACHINPNAGEDDPAQGRPDMSIDAKYGEERFSWIKCEAKLDDSIVRDPDRRTQLWTGQQNKKKYVAADTVYFVWVAQRTILVCDPTGEVVSGAYLEDHLVQAPISGNVITTTDDQRLREHLSLISSDQASSLAFLEEFRQGDLPCCYLRVDSDTVEELTVALRAILSQLRGHLVRRWDILREQYNEYSARKARLQEELDGAGDALAAHEAALYRDGLDDKYRGPRRLFEVAFERFRAQQAYTHSIADDDGACEEALADIFRTDAAYVILGRLLFVRFAEDQTGASGAPLLSRKISNGGLKLWRQLIGAEQPHIGRLVDLAFSEAGTIFEQVFSETPFDALLDLDDRDFDRVLLLVLYKLNAFDFQQVNRDILGDLYQKLLPRDMRKRLGEFYTDDEVVDYILHRTGFVEAARQGAPTIIDPACGSGTFLVRAAYYLIEGARNRGVSDAETLSLVARSIHGLDINDFAVFIARVNLLFTCFDLMINARQDVAFRIHEANSLTRHGETPLASVRGATADLTGDAMRVRMGHYDFVVGNPPYVHPRRIPADDAAALRTQYITPTTSVGNINLSYYFMLRTEAWLDAGATAGFIVPRSLADSVYSAPWRNSLDGDQFSVQELSSLDWACHDLFDSDCVPMIVIWSRSERPADHTVAVATAALTKKEDIAQAIQAWPGYRISWPRFAHTSPIGWLVDAQPCDLPVLDVLQSGQTVRTRSAHVSVGVEVGTSGDVGREHNDRRWPLFTGSDIYPFYTASPARFADPTQLSNRAIWRDEITSGTQQELLASGLPAAVLAVPKIYTTTIAAVVDARYALIQNNCTIVVPNDRWPAASLACLLNSEAIRYYHGALLRTSVAGGNRRDASLTPRVVGALPVPPSAPHDELAILYDQITEVAPVAAKQDAQVWAEIIQQYPFTSSLSAWPLDWHAWGSRALSSKSVFDPGSVERSPGEVKLSRSVALASRDDAALDFLSIHIPLFLLIAEGRLSKEDAEALAVPHINKVPELLRRYRALIAGRNAARERYLEIIEQIDECIFDAFALDKQARATVRRRMATRPLSTITSRYRKPWEPTKPPQIQLFRPGERYR